MKRKDFFIGWQDEAPKGITDFYRRFKWPFFVALPILVLLLVWLQKPFNDHKFEFGSLTEVTGVFYAQPIPILLAEASSLPKGIAPEILLVGYGKFGAEGIMKEMAAQHGSLNGKKITLAGTLIYGDGKTLMELTEEEGAFRNIESIEPTDAAKLSGRSPVALTGEIVDPKCYFGVMKPGEGKTHRSCAIRCISGGIPPVFRHETGNKRQKYKYYLMLDKNNNKINTDILPYVAERMNVQGNASEFMGWDIVYVDIDKW